MKNLFLALVLLFMTKISTAQIYRMNDVNGKTLNICKGQFTSSKFTNPNDGINNLSDGYSNNENYTVTFCSGDPTRKIRANFFYVNLAAGDVLSVYDGPTATGVAKTYTGGFKFPGNVTSTGTCLTFKFVSNGSGIGGGWDVFLGCTPTSCGVNQPASDECISATPICNLGGYCGSTSGWYTRGAEADDIDTVSNSPISHAFCGETHNNSWVYFFAATTKASFDITSNNCSDPAKGIQAVILESNDCKTFIRKSLCFYDAIGNFTLSASNLTVGKKYYIMIDGSSGNDCEYTILAKSGVQTINITASSTNTLCSGQPLVVTANATGIGPFTYKWSPKPMSANADSSTVTFPVSVGTTYTCSVTGVCGTPTSVTYTPSANTTPTLTATDSAHICTSGTGTVLTAAITAFSPTINFANYATASIPDNNATGIGSDITVGSITGNVGNELQQVCFSIDHGTAAELDISLRAPDGTTIDLSSGNGGTGSNYNKTCFTASGAPSITSGTAPFTGTYMPEQPFSGLSAAPVNGKWSLVVKDTKVNNTGLLTSWSIAFKNDFTYSWSPSTGLSGTTGTTVTANPATTTTYTATVTDKAGCAGSKLVKVRVTNTPDAPLVTSPVIYCVGATAVPLTATGTGLLWYTTATGGTGAATAPTPSTTTAGSVDYYVSGAAAICEGPRSKITVVVNSKIDASFGYASGSFCQNTTNPFPVISPGAVAGTFQSTPAGLVFVDNKTGEIDLKASTPGTYIITNEIAPVGGCATVTSTPVTITIYPEPTLSNSSTASVCSGVALNIPLTSPVSSDFSWIAANNTNTSGETYTAAKQTNVINDIIVNNTNADEIVKYTVTLTSKTGACKNIKPQTIDVTVKPEPKLINTPATAAICSDVALNIPLSSTVPADYSWIATDNSNTSGETHTSPKTTKTIDDVIINNTSVPQVVSYTITLTSKTGTCTNITPQTLDVTVNKTVATFTPDPSTGEMPLSVKFKNASTGASNYSWDFGNGGTSNQMEPTYIYNQLGTFEACLLAEGNSCVDKTCVKIRVYINSAFVIPNIFTPNNDGKNDVFAILGKGIESMHVEIFNRWGQKEYEWNTPNGGWDGRSATGLPATSGTYYFIMQANGADGKTYSEQGSLTLIRER